MSQVSNGQMAKFFARTTLKEDSPGFISGELFQAFLEGRLVLKPQFVNCAFLKIRFDWVWDGYDRITEIVTIPVRKDVMDTDSTDDLELIEIDRHPFSSEQGRADIIARGFLPATFNEGLLYAKKYPNAQLERPYSVLGTELLIDAHRYVPYFYRQGDGRSLRADRITTCAWDRYYLCLVRKLLK